MLRGKGFGVEVVLAGRVYDEAFAELRDRLREREGFYRGTVVTVVTDPGFGDGQAVEVREVLEEAGMVVQGFSVQQPAGEEELARRRAARPRRHVELSDAARSLVADFAGARADIAQRRKRGEASVPRFEGQPGTPQTSPQQPVLSLVEPVAGTLYHVGTLRGGQSLQHIGNIVIVGDVNPGAEVLASGDVVVFGRLAGVAHAGAQGDANARVYALELEPTQLRIATSIAAENARRATKHVPEVAAVRDGHIVVAPLGKQDAVFAEEVRR